MKFVTAQGHNIPALGLGTYTLTGKTAIRLIEHALSIGYRHLDTAQFYYNEEEVGKAVKNASPWREEVFLTTKVWPDSFPKHLFAASVEESLRKLDTDYVDLLLLHWPNADVSIEETIAELIKVRDRGLTRLIGVSNFPVALIQSAQAAAGGQLIANQVEYHVFMDQAPVYKELRKKDMMLTAYCPIAKGKVVGHPVIKAIAEKHRKSEAQIALRWLIEQEGVSAIPRSSQPNRLEENISIFDFALDQSDKEELDSLGTREGRMIRPAWEPEWD